MHQLHKKDKVKKYIEAMLLGMSVRRSAKYAGISKNTAFAWRHKLLSSLTCKTKPQETGVLAGASIIKLPYSAKGRKKPPEKCTQPTKSLLIATEDRVMIKKIKQNHSSYQVAQIISESIKNSHIHSVPSKILSRAVNKQSNATKTQSIVLKKKCFYMERQVESKLMAWMERFRGVASKYIQHYWDWFVYLQESNKIVDGTQEFFKWCTSSASIEYYNYIKEK